jgi:SAM-dependent methyltransferase
LTLDVATGGGHTARALAGTGRAVLATDVTPEMIEAARSEPHPRVRWAVADAAAQPVGDGSVAVAAVRIAPHHFSDLASFLSEARRALGVTGLLLIVDNVADPRADEWLNRMERLRDPSHVRSYTVDEWGRAVRSARFEILEVHTMFRRNDFSTWLHRPRPGPEAAHAVVGAFLDAPPEAAALYDIRIESGQVVSWRDQKILVAARPS